MRGSFVWVVFVSLLVPLAASAQDRDGDRLLDDLDLCPDVAEGPATLFPGDGCPDLDTDGDRIVDDHDVCPAEPETVNGFEDADGCVDAEGASAQLLADRARSDELSGFEGFYVGDARMDVEIGASASESVLAMRPGHSVLLDAFAGRTTGDRVVLVFSGPGREEVLVMRVLEGGRVVGRIEVREGTRVTRLPWMARRSPRFEQRIVIHRITAQRALLQACYEDEVRRAGPSFRGRIEVELTVAVSGETESVHIVRDELSPPRPEIGPCFVRALDGFVFSPGPLRAVTYAFPFEFEPNTVRFRPNETEAARAQDRDGDRLLDDLDLCPDVAEGPATLFPGDGCPDLDTDGDRIVDDHDVCPAEPETVNGFEDADGCADAEGASAQLLADRIHFATGSHELDGGARVEVRRVAAWLEAHPEALHVQIIGRADARGSAAQNDVLSLNRAQSVQSALVERGIAATRLTARGLGALPGDTVEARAENRRVELHVALAGREPDGAALARFRGDYDGAPVMLRVGASTREAVVTLHPIEQGVHLMAYASRVVGDRLVLSLAGADREMTITLRLVERGAIGVIETRRGATVERATWSARHEPPFDQSVVVQRITRDRSAIQACYQRELEREHTLSGRVVVTMTVLESGEVEGVRIVEDTTTPPRTAVGACVVRVVDGFVFHPGPTGGSVSFTFPFVFEPQVE